MNVATMAMMTIAIILSALSSVSPVAAPSTPAAALLILSKRDQTLAIVDPASLQVLTTLPAGPDPHEVVASADGKMAFIANYGGGAYNTISVVDLGEQKLKNIARPVRAYALRLGATARGHRAALAPWLRQSHVRRAAITAALCRSPHRRGVVRTADFRAGPDAARRIRSGRRETRQCAAAFDRCPAFHEPERRSGAGLFRRWPDRRPESRHRRQPCRPHQELHRQRGAGPRPGVESRVTADGWHRRASEAHV